MQQPNQTATDPRPYTTHQKDNRNSDGGHEEKCRAHYMKQKVAVPKLTRAREWGPELRARERGQNQPTPAISAPMKARITKFLWKVGWLKISIMCNFGDPRSISSR